MLYLRGLEQLDEAADEADYTRRIPAVAALKRLEFRCPVTFFVGENGSGKSTLLEAIAVAWGFNPEGGSRNFRFSSRDTHSGLYRRLRLVRGSCIAQDGYFLRSESLYNMASYVDELAGATGAFCGSSAGAPCTADPMGRACSPWPRTVSGDRAFICWTSLRPPCPRSASSPFWRCCTVWRRRAPS